MRVKLTGVKHMRNYQDSEYFRYGRRRDRDNGPLVQGLFYSDTFQVYYYDTKMVEHYQFDQTYLPRVDWASMNSAVVINHFIPEGYFVKYTFKYERDRYGYRYRQDEHLALFTTKNGGTEFVCNLDEEGFWILP